jgi:O-antigen/teichoic acid export membrane protein
MVRRLRTLFVKLWSFNLALLDQAFVSGAGFIMGILVARLLSPSEFGQYVLAFIIIFAVNTFQQALVTDPMLSIGAKKPSEIATPYFSAILLHQAFLSLVLVILMSAGYAVASTVFLTGQIHGLLLSLLLASVGFQWQEFMRRYFFVRGRLIAAIVNDVIRYGTQLVGVLALMRWDDAATSSHVLLVVAGSGALSVCHAGILFGPIRWQREIIRSSAREHWRYSRWLVPSAGLKAVNTAIFMAAAGYFHGAASAGRLRAAQNLVAFVHIFYMGLDAIALAKTAHAFWAHGVDALRGIVLRLALVGGGVVISLLLLVCLNAQQLLSLFYGGRYHGIEYLVDLWALSYAIMFFVLPLGVALRAMEMTRPLFVVEALQSIFAVLSVYPLLKYLGPSGAVVGSLGCNVIVVTYFGAVLRKRLRRNPVVADAAVLEPPAGR